MLEELLRLLSALPARAPAASLPGRLDQLFRLLAGRPAQYAEALEDMIWSLWMYHPHRAAALALDRATGDIAARRYDIAETRLALLLRSRPAHQRVVLDLADLKFMDSTGLRVLLRARAAADEGRWEIGLRNVPPTIRRLFDMTGVHAALPAEIKVEADEAGVRLSGPALGRRRALEAALRWTISGAGR